MRIVVMLAAACITFAGALPVSAQSFSVFAPLTESECEKDYRYWVDRINAALSCILDDNVHIDEHNTKQEISRAVIETKNEERRACVQRARDHLATQEKKPSPFLESGPPSSKKKLSIPADGSRFNASVPKNGTPGGGSAMDRLGDLNNNLGTVSGNAGGAQIGRRAIPSDPVSPTTSAPANAGAAAPTSSNPSVFISKPTPTFNNSNTIR